MSRATLLIGSGIFGAMLVACTASPERAAPDGGGSPTGSADAGPTADATIAPPFTSGVSTLAGAAEAGSADGDRNTARFSNPVNMAYGPDGRVYVADFDDGLLRAVDAAGNVTTVFAQAGFIRPFGLAFAADGTLYVETDNDSTGANDPMSGTVWTVDVTAHTATVLAERVGRPRGLAVLPSGLLAMSDELHHVIETLDPTTGAIVTIAGTWGTAAFSDGTGSAALFSTPYAMVVQADGTLAVADYGNNRIRVVSPTTGAVTTLAGTGAAAFGDGPIANASFDNPEGLAIDASGTLYVTDANNFRVRRIRAGAVDTIADNGTSGYADANDRLAAEMYGLEGLAAAPDGSMLFVADGDRGDGSMFNRVRSVNMTP